MRGAIAECERSDIIDQLQVGIEAYTVPGAFAAATQQE